MATGLVFTIIALTISGVSEGSAQFVRNRIGPMIPARSGRVPGVSVSQVARRYDVNANLVFAWLTVRGP